jgi:probable HAF family extracellular repeat protein
MRRHAILEDESRYVMRFNSSKRVMLLAALLCGFASAGIANAGSGDIYNLGTLGGPYSFGYALNAGGQVAGASFTGDGLQQAFRYTGTPGSGGAMVNLGTLAGGYESYSRGIHASGQVAGYSRTFGLSSAARPPATDPQELVRTMLDVAISFGRRCFWWD